MVTFYSILLLTTLSILGIAAAVSTSGSIGRRLGASLLTAAQAPLFLGTIAIAAATIAPGHASVIFWLPIVAIAVLALIFLFRCNITVGSFSFSRPSSIAIGCGFISAISILTIVSLFSAILLQNLFPVIGNDALTYLAEARMFASTGSLSALAPGLGDPLSGAPPTHPHTALFSVYLGHALLFSPVSQIAEGTISNDLPVRIAFQFTVLCLALSVSGFTMLLADGKRLAVLTGAIAFLFFCDFKTFEYISFQSSRDAFRLIPWLGLIALLIEILRRRKVSLTLGLCVAATSGWTAAAHTINLYFLAVIAPIFIVVAFQRKIPLTQMTALVASGALGLALPLLHYVNNWRQVGNVLGNGMNYFHYHDTPLAAAFLKYSFWNAKGDSFFSALKNILEQQGEIASSIALLGPTILVICILIDRRRSNFTSTILVATFLSLLTIPLLNLKRIFPIDMKEAIQSNYRYAYTIFVISPIILALAIQHTVQIIELRLKRNCLPIVVTALTAVLAITAGYSLQSWRTYSSWNEPKAYRANFGLICDEVRHLPEGTVWLSDRTTLSYECGRWPTFLYSPVGRQYFSPKTVKEARDRLERNRVALVSLQDTPLDWWPPTSFFQALTEMVADGTFERRSVGNWEVFVRKLGTNPNDHVGLIGKPN